jgi:hypothetical protein
MIKLSNNVKSEIKASVLEIADATLIKLRRDAELALEDILNKFGVRVVSFQVKPNLYSNIHLRGSEKSKKIYLFNEDFTLQDLINKMPMILRMAEKYGKILEHDILGWILQHGSILSESVGDKLRYNALKLKANYQRRKILRKGKKAVAYLGLVVSIVGVIPASLFILGLSFFTRDVDIEGFFDAIRERSSLKEDLEYINLL